MSKLIKNGQVLSDNALLLDDDSPLPDASLTGPVFLSLKRLQSEDLSGVDPQHLGLWLHSEDEVSELAALVKNLNYIACRFDTFVDGRAFSQARILRDQLDYRGELRAVGAYIQDQLHYLSRCGFDAFSVPDDADIDSMLESLADFSDAYQAACDITEPLFRRRS